MLALIPLLILLGLLGSTASARTWLVQADGLGDAPTIQAAVDSCAFGDSVLVEAGTYVENVVLKPTVSLLGSFDPTFTVSDVRVQPSIVDGDSTGSCVTADYGGVPDPLGTLRGFNLTNGLGNDVAGQRRGGGLMSDGLRSVSDCIVEGNVAHAGGGMYCVADSLFVSRVEVRDNRLLFGGPTGAGAYLSVSATAVLDSCEFDSNKPDLFTNTQGVGLFASGPRFELLHSRIDDNEDNSLSSDMDGVGVYAAADSLFLLSCSFRNNGSFDSESPVPSAEPGEQVLRSQPLASVLAGGAVSGRFVAASGCEFERNGGLAHSITLGGAIRAEVVSVLDCSFRENQARGSEDGGFGGAVYADSVTVLESDFIDNSSGFGGASVSFAAAIRAEQLYARNVLFAGNEAIHSGSVTVGAIETSEIDAENITVVNTRILRGNDFAPAVVGLQADSGRVVNSMFVSTSGDANPGVQITGGLAGPVVSRHNLFWANVGGDFFGVLDQTGHVQADPLFADSTAENYGLLLFSPGIDGGDPSILDADGGRSDIGYLGGPGGAFSRPEAIVGLTATPVAFGTQLAWDASSSTGIAGYAIFASDTAGFLPSADSFLAVAGSNSYFDAASYPSASRFYRVSAFDSSGIGGGYSDEAFASAVSVDDPEGSATLLFVSRGANPSPGPFRFELNLSVPALVNARVFDVTGRLVRVLVSESRDEGVHPVVWDGRTAEGSPGGAGTFFLRVDAGGQRFVRKVTLLE